MRRLIPCAAACVALLAGAGPARAGFVTASFTAEVTGAFGTIPGLAVDFGDPVTGSFTYDLDALDADPDPASGFYSSGSATLTIGANPPLNAATATQLVTSDQFILTADLDGGILLTLQFDRPAGASGDALPPATEFTSPASGLFLITHENGLAFIDNVAVTAVEEVSAVPEPSSLALLGAGALFAGMRALRRRAIG